MVPVGPAKLFGAFRPQTIIVGRISFGAFRPESIAVVAVIMFGASPSSQWFPLGPFVHWLSLVPYALAFQRKHCGSSGASSTRGSLPFNTMWADDEDDPFKTRKEDDDTCMPPPTATEEAEAGATSDKEGAPKPIVLKRPARAVLKRPSMCAELGDQRGGEPVQRRGGAHEGVGDMGGSAVMGTRTKWRRETLKPYMRAHPLDAD